MPITTPPTAPSRTDPTTFPNRADAWVAWQETSLVPQINALEATVNAREASTVAASNAAAAVANATLWVSGTSYTLGQAVFDPVNFLTYRRAVAGAGTTRPGLDAVNWVQVAGTGNVSTTGDQTIGGIKTFSSAPVVPDDAFTFAKLQNIPTDTLLGRSTAGTGDVEALSISTAVLTGVANSPGIEIGRHLAGDRHTFIDFHSAGAPSAADFHARIVRNSGINGTLDIVNTGAGGLGLTTGSSGLFLNGHPFFACRAWVNFNGTGTVAIRASGNVSSITDFGVGTYGVNFITAMVDANYSAVGSVKRDGTADSNFDFTLGHSGLHYASDGFAVNTRNSTNVISEDALMVNVAVFR